MPPRPQPKVHQILLKTHKLTIMLAGVSPMTSISQLKKEALEALKDDVCDDILMTISPNPANPLSLDSVHDFNICRRDKENGHYTGTYTVLDPGRQLREHGLQPWETLYLQFINPETRAALPVTVTLPSIDDDDESAAETHPPTAADKGKGKRVAEFSDDDELA